MSFFQRLGLATFLLLICMLLISLHSYFYGHDTAREIFLVTTASIAATSLAIG